MELLFDAIFFGLDLELLDCGVGNFTSIFLYLDSFFRILRIAARKVVCFLGDHVNASVVVTWL